MSVTLTDQDKLTVRTAAYFAVSLLSAADAAGSPKPSTPPDGMEGRRHPAGPPRVVVPSNLGCRTSVSP